MWPHIAMELMWQSGFADKLPSGSEGFRLLCLVTSSQKSLALIPDIREIFRKAKSAVTPCGACGHSTQLLPAPLVFFTKTNPRLILQIEVPIFSLPWSFGGLNDSGFSPHQGPPKVTHSEVPVLRVEVFTEGAPPGWFGLHHQNLINNEY